MVNGTKTRQYHLSYWRQCDVNRRHRHETDIGLSDEVLSEARDRIDKMYKSNEVPRGIAYQNNERIYLINGCLVTYVTGGPGVSHIICEPVINFLSESKANLGRLIEELGLSTSLNYSGENKR